MLDRAALPRLGDADERTGVQEIATGPKKGSTRICTALMTGSLTTPHDWLCSELRG